MIWASAGATSCGPQDVTVPICCSVTGLNKRIGSPGAMGAFHAPWIWMKSQEGKGIISRSFAHQGWVACGAMIWQAMNISINAIYILH
jgi:hypothetical protein